MADETSVVGIEVPAGTEDAARFLVYAAIYGTDHDYRIARARYARRLRSVQQVRWADVAAVCGISKKTLWEWRNRDIERSERECRAAGGQPMTDAEWDEIKLLPVTHKVWTRRPL